MAKDKDIKSKDLQIRNKKAARDYELIEKVEAGIVLVGTEVKSLRSGLADFEGAYARLKNGEVFLTGCKIAAYENAGYTQHSPERDRKLLLHKRQILKLQHSLEQKGFTIIPLRLYFNEKGIAKIELAIARGRKKYDKRDKIIDRDMKKQIKRYKG